jgi:hypothetical protein
MPRIAAGPKVREVPVTDPARSVKNQFAEL